MVEATEHWVDRAVYSTGPQLTRTEASRSAAFYHAQLNDLNWPRGGMVSVASTMCWIDVILIDDNYQRTYVDTAMPIGGPISFAPPGIRVCHRWKQPRLRTLTCLFDPTRLMALNAFAWDWTACSLGNIDARGSHKLQGYMHLLAQELRSPGFASDIQVEALVTLAACEVRSLTGMPAAEERSSRLTQSEMRKVRELVEQADANLSLQAIASSLDLTPREFSAMFKATVGQTFRSYAADSRIKLASTLLANSDMLIKQIAFRCGFSGTAAFTAAFRQATGTSPMVYRAQRSTASNRGSFTITAEPAEARLAATTLLPCVDEVST